VKWDEEMQGFTVLLMRWLMNEGYVKTRGVHE
jgi:hypothetical protein